LAADEAARVVLAVDEAVRDREADRAKADRDAIAPDAQKHSQPPESVLCLLVRVQTCARRPRAARHVGDLL
jgi:hypothetical protein